MSVVRCEDEEATRQAGRDLASKLTAGDVVLVYGDLGAGKTVFVRGLAEGLGVDPLEVASPTFALVNDYGPSGRPPVLLHADLYRLPADSASSDLEALGLLSGRPEAAILAVEWPRPPLTEEKAYRVRITAELSESAGAARLIEIEPPQKANVSPPVASPLQ